MKVFIVLLAIFGTTLSQSISCDYSILELEHTQHYVCNLRIDNPNGLNNFTQIGGFHFPGLNNVFVTAIIRTTESRSANIPDVLCDQFPHVTYLDLSFLGIESVDENAFRRCRNLNWVSLYNNRISRMSENSFNLNRHLEHLDLQFNQLTAVPENLFANHFALQYLNLGFNPFTQPIPGNAFRNLFSLKELHLERNNIREINPAWFQNMINLEILFMYSNQLTSVPQGAFVSLAQLMVLDLGSNQISHVAADALDNLNHLNILSFEANRISSLHPQWFQDKPNLEILYLDYNQIDILPPGIFGQLNHLVDLNMLSNNLRTINRNAFGSLERIWYLDFDDNNINSFDERLLTEPTRLYYLQLTDNVCASVTFSNFTNRRPEVISALERCTNNFRFVIESTTQPGSNYNFFTGVTPGMHFMASSNSDIRIALTSFNIVWNPMLEVVISNGVSRIIMNQATEIAAVPSSFMLAPGQWSRFRITWMRNVVMVFEGDEEFPFMAATMQFFFPVHFYGLRSEQSQASWMIEPIVLPQGN
ncbi:leucine-rich repeat-containing protein 15-like [Chironomus tepperi]|uniref:leucine-rich repeat-containing protein 15-like n=1 Tax=Chironomus tepperi TaxID=113505 RepID=UPI00391F1B2E